MSESFDVVVIGGGPSGSCAASMAAKAGLSVVLLERDKFPREHVGESLLPASMPILRELGVEAEIAAAGFPVKYGATMVWGSGSEPWTWRFVGKERGSKKCTRGNGLRCTGGGEGEDEGEEGEGGWRRR